VKVRLIKPDDEASLIQDFKDVEITMSRYMRLIKACEKDNFTGARIQLIGVRGKIISQHVVPSPKVD
jgi:hypothetical protein